MKRNLLAVFVALTMFAGAAAHAEAAEATAGADLVSAYVWRGITFNDGLVVQPYVDVAAENGFAINVWGNYDVDDYDGALEDNEFSEVDITLSYALPTETVDMTVGHIEYLFPNGGVGTSEIFASISVPFMEYLAAGIDAYYDYDEVEDYYLAATIACDAEMESGVALGVSATVGYAGDDFTIGEDDGLHEYTLGMSAGYPVADNFSISAFVAYTDSFDEDVLPEQDVDFYGGAGFSWSF